MADSIRLGIAKERLAAYYEAEKAVLTGQEYQIGSRRLSRANLSQIQKMIADLEAEVRALEKQQRTGGRNLAFRVIPRDI